MPDGAVTVWFDYACPHSYHGLRRLEELASEIGFEIDRRPFLVRTAPVEAGPVPSDPRNAANDPRRQPLYQPGHGSGTEPASNRSVSTLAIHAATACAKEYALLIGINYYADQRIKPLQGCVNDVNNFQQMLIREYGFAPRRIRVLTDEQATLAAIRAELRNLARICRPSDTLVIHYSGRKRR